MSYLNSISVSELIRRLGPSLGDTSRTGRRTRKRSDGFGAMPCCYNVAMTATRCRAAGDVKAQHFPVWLSIFDAVLAEELPQHLAQAWSALAYRIGRGLSLGLPQNENAGPVPYLGGIQTSVLSGSDRITQSGSAPSRLQNVRWAGIKIDPHPHGSKRLHGMGLVGMYQAGMLRIEDHL